ncbi:MAG: hypothetical protein DMF03_11030 [Verrucomicrobia bacterium]|nr:MAG: hypothetical protein DMF03_11030 [Verrucomicrobiota bacterium]
MSPCSVESSLTSGKTLLAILLCSIISCDGSSSIAGKWRNSGDPSAIIWEFRKDGSVLIGNVRGRYSFGNNQRVKVETPFATSVYRMEFSGDRMILTDPNGSRLEFTKLK